MSKTPDHDFEFDGMFTLPPTKTPDHDAEFAPVSSVPPEDGQLADNEFEQDVVNWLGPVSQPYISASDADVMQVDPDFKKHLHGAYITPSKLQKYMGLDRQPVMRGGDMELVPVDKAVAFATPEDMRALESTDKRTSDTFGHEFIHLLAARADIPELDSDDPVEREVNTRAFLLWRAPDRRKYEAAYKSYISWKLEQADGKTTIDELHSQIKEEFAEGGEWDRKFAAMEGRLMEEQGSPIPKDKSAEQWSIEQRKKRRSIQVKGRKK